MKFIQHHSSSSGNLYEVVASNGQRLIIDPGVTWKEILKALNHDLSGIVGCLVSHEHKDHSKAVKDVMQAGIDVYASVGTLEACGELDKDSSKVSLIAMRRMNFLQDTTYSYIDPFNVFAFNISHDAAEPIGFIIKVDDEYLLFATDTSHIVQKFRLPFNIIAIECSYNGEYLAKKVARKEVDETLAKRLLNSHMEEKETLRYLSEFCDLSACREIHLLHMSADNINKKRITEEIQNKLFIEVVTV